MSNEQDKQCYESAYRETICKEIDTKVPKNSSPQQHIGMPYTRSVSEQTE